MSSGGKIMPRLAQPGQFLRPDIEVNPSLSVDEGYEGDEEPEAPPSPRQVPKATPNPRLYPMRYVERRIEELSAEAIGCTQQMVEVRSMLVSEQKIITESQARVEILEGRYHQHRLQGAANTSEFARLLLTRASIQADMLAG
jgi:hypothetical protein